MNELSFKTKNICAIAIILLITIFLSINTYIILQKNQYYNYCLNEDVLFGIDMGSYLNHLIEMSNSIKNLQFDETFHLLKCFWKPQSFFIFALPFFMIIHNINLFITIINFLLIFLSLFFIYKIVSAMHSIEAGIFASIIFSFTPIFFIVHRTCFLETFASTILIYIYMYINCVGKFNKFSFYVFLTILLSIFLLIKESMFVFLPIIIIFILFNKNNILTNKKIIFNISIVLFVSIIVSYFLWYNENFTNIISPLLERSTHGYNNDYYYYIHFYYFLLSPINSVIFLIASIYFLLKKKHISMLFSLVFIVFISSIPLNKALRHIFPIIWIIPIIISLFIFEIKNKYYKYLLIIFILCFYIIQFFLMNYMPIKYFKKMYICNEFKGVTYYNYKPIRQTALEQYKYYKKLLGDNFMENTCFINFYLSYSYNIIVSRKDINHPLCKNYWYTEEDSFLQNIQNIENVVINDGYTDLFVNMHNFLLKNNFVPKQKINIDITEYFKGGNVILYRKQH